MSAAKLIGRRLFARGAVIGAPVALKMGNLPPAVPPTGGSLIGQSGMGGTAAEIAKQTFMSKVWDTVRRGLTTEREHANLRYVRRQMMGGLDPDLAVLNSMHLARRVQIQIDREKQHEQRERSIRHRLIRGMGGNPEEFE